MSLRLSSDRSCSMLTDRLDCSHDDQYIHLSFSKLHDAFAKDGDDDDDGGGGDDIGDGDGDDDDDDDDDGD
eukprot:765878-Hanusia_phi.AAC.1